MKLDLSKYENLNICVAVSGGRDSMALLHYLLSHGKERNITVCAVNFDHKIRGESSSRDSAFVADYCAKNGIPLLFFAWDSDCAKTENSARLWRRERYAEAVLPRVSADGTVWKGADAVATAHHLNDIAETVLFNLARGSGLAGLRGVTDAEMYSGGKRWKLIRPLAEVSRAEIDEYIRENSVPFVDDETNFTDDYTRNKIRHNVLPELEKAVPHAAEAICRFSRIAAEDEEFFENLLNGRGAVKRTPLGFEISRCLEKPLFKRAALKVLEEEGVRDYTSAWLENLYALQFAERGKKFEFAGYAAYCEEGKIAICIDNPPKNAGICVPFSKLTDGGTVFPEPLYFGEDEKFRFPETEIPLKTLRFDPDKIPENAVVRFMRAGDRFAKFGGGAKNLGSYFTDLKIPVRVRGKVPVVAAGNEILIVCGVEISRSVSVDGETVKTAFCVAPDYVKLCK